MKVMSQQRFKTIKAMREGLEMLEPLMKAKEKKIKDLEVDDGALRAEVEERKKEVDEIKEKTSQIGEKRAVALQKTKQGIKELKETMTLWQDVENRDAQAMFEKLGTVG